LERISTLVPHVDSEDVRDYCRGELDETVKVSQPCGRVFRRGAVLMGI
jgi:hypothetical protein